MKISFKTLKLEGGQNRLINDDEAAKFPADKIKDWEMEAGRVTVRDLIAIEKETNSEPGLSNPENGRISSVAYAAVRASNLLTLKLTAWNNLDENGNVLPICRETIDELDPDVAILAARRIENGIVPEPEALEAKNLSGGTGTKATSSQE